MAEATYPFSPEYAVPPGETLREALEYEGMSQAELAQRTDLSAKHINELVNAKAPISVDTALRLERVLRIPASLWLSLEAGYREQLLREAERARLGDEAKHVGEFPYAALVKAGVVRHVSAPEERAAELLRFFGVHSLSGLREVYPAALSVSGRRRPSPGALMAWLRMGELEARELEADPFDLSRLRARTDELRGLSLQPPEEAAERLRTLLAACGVLLVHVPHLPRTYAHGATRWLGSRPLVQLTVRGKWEDVFWFSLCHELGHIVREHSRKAVFIAWDGGGGEDELEREADQYAADVLVPPREYGEFAAGGAFAEGKVRRFAAHIGVCPGVVVGRLQQDGLLPHTHLNQLRRKLPSFGAPE